MDDPYKTLGVTRDADAAAIRRAYIALAKRHHPDLNPGDAKSLEWFKSVSAANELLSDPEKRGQYDRGEIDATGQAKAPEPTYRDFADGAAGRRYGRAGNGGDDPFGGWSEDDLGDMFGSIFGRDFGRGGTAPARGMDERYGLTTEFLDAVNGATRRMTLPDGRALDVKIPSGARDGVTLRLKGQGGAGRNGGPPGDALIEIHVAPHPWFHLEGRDIRLELPVTLSEAVLGGPIEVPTPGGPVRMRVPPHSDTGTVLRLRGRGAPARGSLEAGDLYATLRLVLGGPDPALDAFLRDWRPERPITPRRAMEGTP